MRPSLPSLSVHGLPDALHAALRATLYLYQTDLPTHAQADFPDTHCGAPLRDLLLSLSPSLPTPPSPSLPPLPLIPITLPHTT